MITDYLYRRHDRNQHWDVGMDAGRIIDLLYTVDDPRQRALLLRQLADLEGAIALIHPRAFGPTPNPDEAGRDVAESIGSSALLLRALAATERPAGEGVQDFTEVDSHLDEADRAEAAAWRKLATVRDRYARANLIISGIYDYAVTRYGRQAAEVLVTVAKTERELASAQLAGRVPAVPADPLLSLRRRIGAAFILAFMFLALIILLGPHHH